MKYPISVRSGSTQVKIYRIKSSRTKSGHLYTVAWHDGGARRTKQIADLTQAKFEAREIADNLQAGRANFSAMRTADIDELTTIRKEAGDFSPIQIIKEWKRARDICGDHIVEAAESWAKREQAQEKRALLKDVVDQFIDAKRKAGKDVHETYVKRGYFPPLVAAFPEAYIDEISTIALSRYLSQWDNPTTRNTNRQKITTMFRWAQRMGYLPHDRKTVPELTDRYDEEVIIEHFKPEEFKKILKLIYNEQPHYLAALVVAGFCGLRRREVHNQDWSDIYLDKSRLYVTSAKKGTPQDRYVPIPEAGVKWLMLCEKKTGKLCSNLALDRIRDIVRSHKIATPSNGFRRAYISYHRAMEVPAATVASWAGNSEKQINRHYRKPRPFEEGEAWFALTPDTVLESDDNKIVEMEAAK